jgi:hypothetical protein
MLEGKGATAKPVANPAEVEILELAIGSIVDHDMTVKEAADSLNNLGKVNRHGGKWEQSNLRQILLGNALLGFMAFRDEEANGSRANAARDEETGEYLHGDTGRVSLPEIIPLERIKAVRAALTRRGPQRHREAGMYLLSKRLFGLCGNYYSGAVKTHNDRRSYRCTGTLSSHKNYVGCGCTEIDADEVERVVWQTVSEGFRDRGHLQDLADQWLGAVPLLATGYRERIAELEELLERKRKSRKKRLVTLLALADDDDDFDAEMLADVKAELKNQETKIEKELNQVRGWLADAEVQEQRVADVLTLADRVRPDLDSLTEMQMLDALTLFDIGVHVRSRVERRAVKPTEFETWFKGSGLLVPAVLSDESWAAVVDLFPPARGTKPQRSRREILDAVFYKVRHGLSWPEMPEEFTAVESIKVLATKLLRDGSLPEAVQRLQGFGGTPPPSLNPLPDLHIEASFMERRPDPSNLTMECVTEGPSRVTFAEVLHREYVTAAS